MAERSGLTRYYASAGVFLAALGLLLFTMVDVRRGFLFADYYKVGSPSVLLHLDWHHLPLLLVGGLGVWLAHRHMTRLERGLRERSVNLGALTAAVAIIIGVFLVADLFAYRGVPASRILSAGQMTAGSGPMGLGRAIPIAYFPGVLQSPGDGVNYLLLVWHATTLGILLGSLFLVMGKGLVTRLVGNGFGAHFAGTAVSLAQPFCSCCAAPIGSALYRRGASLGLVLAFTVSAPMLNITGLILASALLPAKFALIRIVGGIVLGLFITYVVARIAAGWVTAEESQQRRSPLPAWIMNILDRYGRLFSFEKLLQTGSIDSPAALISNWLRMAGRLAKVLLPVLLIGSILAVYIVQAMPDAGNNVPGVAVTALFATFIMVPTWTEIPFAMALLVKRFTGIAATVLITLPAVSLPCLLVLAGAIRSFKVVALLAGSVFLAGLLAGIIFL